GGGPGDRLPGHRERPGAVDEDAGALSQLAQRPGVVDGGDVRADPPGRAEVARAGVAGRGEVVGEGLERVGVAAGEHHILAASKQFGRDQAAGVPGGAVDGDAGWSHARPTSILGVCNTSEWKLHNLSVYVMKC